MDDTDTTTDPDRMPTWNEMRDLVRAGTDPDLPVRPPEPAGSSLNRARVQRWARGDYDDQLARERPIAQPAPPPPKPRPRVTVKVPEAHRPGPRDGYDRLAARLRAAGVDAHSTGRSLRIPGDQQAEAARLLRGWAREAGPFG